jgi:hypothetical protein
MHENSAPATRTAPRSSERHPVGPPGATASDLPRDDVLGWGSLITRLLGAVAVLVIGVVHLQAYNGPYSAVPTIGRLFLVNFAAAMAIGVALLLPIGRLTAHWAGAAIVLVTMAGIGLAAVSFGMLVVSEHGTLFGFHEPGYDPTAIARSRIAEVVAVALLVVSLALRTRATARPRW